MRFMLILPVAISIVCSGIQAQPGWNWPEDQKLAQEKNALYSDVLKTETTNLQSAIAPHTWLLENAPDLNPSIYINGVKLYKTLAEAESDINKKRDYHKMVFKMYDMRIKYFNDEAKVLNRKAYDAYKILKNDKDRYPELFQLYEKTFELNGNKVGINNLVAYMDVIRRYQLATGALSDEDILDRYDKLMGTIDHQIQSGGKRASLEKNREFIDRLLPSMIDVDCDFIENKLGPKLEENAEDLKLAKKIMGLSLAASGCSERDIFITAAMVVQKQEPTYSMAKVLAIKMEAAGNHDKADQFFKEATDLAETPAKKAEMLYILAGSAARRGQKSNARKHALAAVAADPGKKEAYKFIGDLYMASYEDCKGGVSRVQDRAVFLAAYEMYKKAGNSKMMQLAKAQFPSMEEIFELSLKEGETLRVGCWINETVTIQRRPS